MTFPICPCDGAHIETPVNLPALPRIAYRVGTYADFRRAILAPVAADALSDPVWRTNGGGDLAVMIAEWFAYIADILTFYNERIANEDCLGTAELPESVAHLIALLGYRPRPAIGATGYLAALVTPGQSVVLPKGLQFQSKPAPGQEPQTFELAAATPIGALDQIPATPPPALLAVVPPPPSWGGVVGVGGAFGVGAISRLKIGIGIGRGHGPVVHPPAPGSEIYSLLLAGKVNNIDPGDYLLLAPRDPTIAPLLTTVKTATVQPMPAGAQQTRLTFTPPAIPPDGLTAAQAQLQRTNQSANLWSLFDGAVDGNDLHLASLVRQIRPDDWVLITNPPDAPLLVQVTATREIIWDANGKKGDPNPSSDHPVPIPHTVLNLLGELNATWGGKTTVRFGWIAVGTLIDQPFGLWNGTPTATLVASGAQPFPKASGYQLLLQDANGIGVVATGSSNDGETLALGSLPDPEPALQPPFTLLPNLLKVTRGKTVANEVLGSGDATNPAESFRLKQSPVTYLQQGAGFASTISLTVGGRPWTEVASFYEQGPDATVFVTSEDDDGKTRVTFGDGVNGARLPTGTDNVVATYRIGAGTASPAAGKLTVITQSYPGLRAVLNPVAVGGGADADPPDKVRRYAPHSVLAFGRAVSVFDYEAIAALTPGVTRARAVWAWDDTRQRTLVTVYVGDDAAAAAAAKTALSAAGDPNRPIKVVQATPVVIALALTVTMTPGMDPDAITADVVAALTNSDTGLFGAARAAIGQPVVDSTIGQAVLAVPGAVAITAATFFADDSPNPGPLHDPGEGGYFTLAPTDISVTPEPDAHGG
jgi:hypothetical protein